MLEPLEPGEHTIILADDSSGPAAVDGDEVTYSTGTAYAVYKVTVPDDGAESTDPEAEATE